MGLAHRSLEGIAAIGVGEIQWQRGHKYLTLVYQPDPNRSADIAPRLYTEYLGPRQNLWVD